MNEMSGIAPSRALDRVLVLETVRVTEAAALAAAELVGRGDEKAADAAAVAAMRAAFNELPLDGRIVIGEGERDEAPMLYIGERVGMPMAGGTAIDIAVDPLEGTTIAATGGPNALAVLAIAERGGLLHAPDVYMAKLSIGPGFAPDVVDLLCPPGENVRRLAEAKGVSAEEITACVLDRPRHAELIADLRAAGCSVRLIPDGDVAGVIAVANPASGIDIYLGTGGAPEGVLAAAALRCIGGQFFGRLLFRNEDERGRAEAIGITDFDRVYALEDLVPGDAIFSATGVTDGSLLKGVKRNPSGGFETHSVVMRASSGTVRWVSSRHRGSRQA